jgi:PAS domain S-box-containing protein
MMSSFVEVETNRLEALEGYRAADMIDGGEYGELAMLAARLCEAPFSAVVLVDRTCLRVKASAGLSVSELPRSYSFCGHTILQRNVLVIPDALTDARFRSFVLVASEPYIRFYAGAPIVTPDGHALGTLCVMDTIPRALTGEQTDSLRMLAGQVLVRMELDRLSRSESNPRSRRGARSSPGQAHHTPAVTALASSGARDAAESQTGELPGTSVAARIGEESGEVVLWDWDLRSNAVYYSPQWKRKLGYGDREIGTSVDEWLDRLHPADRPQVTAELDDCILVTRDHYEGVFRLRHRDGSYLWMMARAAAQIGSDGTTQRLFGCHIDITERKRFEEAQAQLVAILEATTDFVAIADISGKTVYVNRAGRELLGVPAGEDLSNTRVRDYCPPWAAELILKEAIPSAMRDGVWSGETALLTRDSREIPVSQVIIGHRSASGKVNHLSTIARDISDRKRVEEQLRFQKVLLECQTEAAPDGIIVVAQDGAWLSFNRRFVEMWKMPAGIAASRDIEAALSWIQDNLADSSPLGDLARDSVVEAGEVRREIVLNDGRIFEHYGSPILGPDGVRYGRVVFHRDITERKKLEDQFRQSQKMEAIGRLAGGVAHDFNNLLTAIIGYSQLLLTDLKRDSVCFRMAEEITRAGERAAALTGQLLAFSRRQVLQPRVLNLNSVVGEIHKMLRRLIGEDIELVTILDPDLGLAKADPAQLEQVIMNLAVNARDAMPDGGTLTLTTSSVFLNQPLPAAGDLIPEGAYVTVRVADSGFGMDEAILAKIFEPFYTTKEMGRGTGLGLSTVYGIVRQSDGYIRVRSEVGAGTEFELYLPRVSGAESEIRRADDSSEMPGGTETVLLVEDEPIVRRLAAGVLRERGYTVIEAANGEEAIRLANETTTSQISLLVTDVVMPRLGGRELASRLARSNQNMRVLFISGYTEDPAFQRGSVTGAAFLSKPFSPKELAEKVREVLET